MAEKKLKIAFLNIYQGRVGRGAETFIYELSNRLSSDFEVDIIAGNKGAFVRWPILWRLFLDPTGINVLLFTFKSIPQMWNKKYDIVIPSNGGWQSLIVRIITLLYGGKMVVSGQSGIGWDDRVNLLMFPNVFIGLSSRAKLWANKINPFIKTAYIPNGVDLDMFKPNGKTYNFNLSKPIILCVAALTKTKNVDKVIYAVEKVHGASLVVIGDGYLREETKFLGRRILNDRFHLETFSYEQMPEVYRGADVFTLVSSEREAFGIVFAEAMASGLPVVARNDEQRKEVIGEAGILVNNPNDSDELALALTKSIGSKWGETPRKQAQNFDWNIIAKKYKDLFLEITK